MKTIKSRTALACEYLADGSYLKHTLVNMYSTGNIIVQKFPAVVPIAFYIEIEVNFSGFHEIEFQILSGKKLLAKLIAGFDFEVGKLGLVTLPQLPIKLDGPTELRVVATGSEIKQTTLAKRKFIQGELPTFPIASQ